MVGHDERRLERLGIIRRSIKEAGKELDMEKLIAVGCSDWGCTRRTMKEYIRVITEEKY